LVPKWNHIEVFMKTITLKNIPDRVYERLKLQAKASHRSLNGEIIYWLERSLGIREIPSADETIEKARRFREKIKIVLTDDEISEAKRAGRS
jgi:antitoxin FitA